MDNWFGPLIFIVFIVIAIARKLNKQKAEAEQRRREEAPGAKDLPETTRRAIYGPQGGPGAQPGGVRMARPRGEEPVAPGKQLMQALLGQLEEEDEDPRPQPAQRVEAPRQVQERPAPQRQVAEVQRARPVQQAQRTVAQRQRPAPRQAAGRQAPPDLPDVDREKRREELLRRRKEAQEARRQKAVEQQEKARTKKRSPSRRPSFLWRDLNDVRRAVVFTEILGPPKSLQ